MGCAWAQVAITLLCVASAAFGLLWAGYHQPYTAAAPKKVYLYHVHNVGGEGQGSAQQQCTWEVLTLDSGPVQRALPPGLAGLQELPAFSAGDTLALYPASRFMQVGGATCASGCAGRDLGCAGHACASLESLQHQADKEHMWYWRY